MPPREIFEVGEYVRWSDVDAAGIICYGAYVRFFEIAETELFRSVGMPYGEVFERFDFWLPRAAMHFEFKSPAVLDEALIVRMWVGHVGRSSLRLDVEVVRREDRSVTAEGQVTLVAVDRAALRPCPLPSAFVQALDPYSGSEESP